MGSFHHEATLQSHTWILTCRRGWTVATEFWTSHLSNRAAFFPHGLLCVFTMVQLSYYLTVIKWVSVSHVLGRAEAPIHWLDPLVCPVGHWDVRVILETSRMVFWLVKQRKVLGNFKRKGQGNRLIPVFLDFPNKNHLHTNTGISFSASLWAIKAAEITQQRCFSTLH